MNAPAVPDSAPAPAGTEGRARVRLFALAVLVACWVLPWPQMEIEVQQGSAEPTYDYAALTGAERTGAIGALSLLAIWGLAATALAARTHRGLRLGTALTEAGVALGATVLLLLEHPWIPGGEIREAWGAIFGPLALLALLEAGTLAFAGRAHRVVAVIRAGAALFAAGCLAVSLAWVPAGVALWLALSPLLLLKVTRVRGGRRLIEGLLLVTTIVHGFSFRLHDMFVGVGVPTTGSLNLPFAAWGVLTAVITVTALDGLMRPEDDAAAGV
ncbi:MAG: hypothetical protein QNJ98_18510 [Planctomycetota bacterium]|nr:hypothetical protein [Planctomycetota bacterium]